MAQSTPSSRALTLSYELSQKLREHSERVLLGIINANSATRYVCESPDMRDFHIALAAPPGHEGSSKIDAFYATIPLTNYSTYEPFVSRFFEEPCKESQLKDLLSPGLPIFIAISSSTSGGAPKFFPKYIRPRFHPTKDVGNSTTCAIYSFCYQKQLQVEGSDAQQTKNILVCGVSCGIIRCQIGALDADDDEARMNSAFPGATSPVAVYFIRKYRPFLLMHALFALRHRTLEKIHTTFGTVLHDMMRYIAEEWDTLVDCIEHGKLPDYDGIGHVKVYLEPQMVPDPKRAAELRAVGLAVDGPGWLKKIWPSLDAVIGVVSGVFGSVIPNLRYYVGPGVRIRTLGFGSSEALIGLAYEENEVNLFKATTEDIIEYLDFASGEDVSNLVPAWEVKVGSKYEVVLTTREGLWRYRLGDIIKITGFDPKDGLPVFEYVERINVAMCLGHAHTSEKQLIDAIRSTTKDTLGHLVEFTVVNDERKAPATYGYIVEISGSPGPNAHLAVQQVLDTLSSSNGNVQSSIAMGNLRTPTIQIVEPGTFRDFRTRKMEELNVGAGQIKIPVVLTNLKMEEWLLGKVIQEL